MKLDATVMSTLTKEDYRILESVSSLQKSSSHLVPPSQILSHARLRHGGAHKVISGLCRDNLLSHDRGKTTDGYRLTNSGYDILALHSLRSRKIVSALGDKIGTGKESDIYLALSPKGTHVVLKFHRLGRTSFRSVRKLRSYGRDSKMKGGWLALSRLSAIKEFAFMKALKYRGYPVPEPIAHSRHVVVMGLVRGVPLYQIRSGHEITTAQSRSVYGQSLEIARRLRDNGLVHCDLNEFNLMVDLSGVQDFKGGDADEHYVRASGVDRRGGGVLSEPMRREVRETNRGRHDRFFPVD